MNNTLRLAAALVLGCTLSPSHALSPLQGREIVDVFPCQNWASLGRIEPLVVPSVADEPALDDAPSVPQISATPEDASGPFELLGQWHENGASAFVVGAAGETFILCGSACEIRGAIHPGQKIGTDHRLKSLSPAGIRIAADTGTTYDLPTSGLNPSTH